MAYKAKSGETEFGGVGGMFPEQMREAPTLQQEMWALYATDEAGGVTEDGEDVASEEYGRDHIGEPRNSFTIPTEHPNLTITGPWSGLPEEEWAEDEL